jgi:hypothetical protein
LEVERISEAPASRVLPAGSGDAGIDPLELYASGIDTSDYVTRITPPLRAAIPRVGDLLDIGAGGGQLGAALRDPGAAWTAIEPAQVMQTRLRDWGPPPTLEPVGWRESELPAGYADTVLAANMPAPLIEASTFLKRCRSWARRNIVWLVPAQNGPRGLCLAGCLPREWHGEDETPGVDIVLRSLPKADHPAIVATVDWTFSLAIHDLPRIAAYLADRLGWTACDPRRSALREHLATQATPITGGHRLSVPRASALLVWRNAS